MKEILEIAGIISLFAFIGNVITAALLAYMASPNADICRPPHRRATYLSPGYWVGCYLNSTGDKQDAAAD